MSILFDIDGQHVDPEHASWYLYEVCGCASGVTLASCGDGRQILDEDGAWKNFFPNAEMRRREQSAGRSVRLGLCSEVRERLVNCTHIPKWGRMETPIPAGHRWARQDEVGTKGRRKHLVLGGFEDGRLYGFKSDNPALCGAQSYTWTSQPWAINEIAECVRCQRLAKTTAGEASTDVR